MKRYIMFLSIMCSMFFLLVGCGTKEEKTAEKKEKQAIAVTDFAGQTITFEHPSKSIATLSVGDMDIIHTLGGNVVGRPNTKLPLSKELQGIQEMGNAHEPNFERIASVKPELFVLSSGLEKHIPTIESQGIKVMVSSANSIKDIQKSIDLYGMLLGKEEKAKELNKNIDDQLKAYDTAGDVRALLVYGAPGSYLVALPTSLSGDILDKVGGQNIAVDFPKTKEFPQYAQLSTERIIEANPDIIFLITHGDPEGVKKAFEGEMMKNDAWKNLEAVKQKRVVVLPPHLFGSNPGTHIVEAVDFMAQSLQDVRK
ncbi:ABC transporter substrate-binding protein [Bacillus sp. REN10]|uniref:ABC transporter substrate-binding protein n=1 Tax=Bacillus sp. REN10 TaxID=2782541 RepID=UPI00193B992F|nr:ABC transporter substrate-binding protein [Bacillus sp. REN10]